MVNKKIIKNITTDDLALMVQGGFNDITSKMATKVEMKKGFEEVNEKLDRIENVLIKKNTDDIEYLKARVKKLEDALAIE